jgi:hypothetical protein
LTAEQAGSVIHGIQTQSDRPLVLVAGDLRVLEAALREIPGSPAVLCPGCDREALRKLASKYGALAV